jgi:hypothetical protein
VDHYLPYYRQCLITHLLSAVYFCRLCLLKVCTEFSSFLLLPFQRSGLLAIYFSRLSLLKVPTCPVCSEHQPSLLHIPFQFLVYYSVFLFLWGRGQSVQGAMLVYPRGSCGNTTCCLFAHLLVCVSQAGLELAFGGSPSFSM